MTEPSTALALTTGEEQRIGEARGSAAAVVAAAHDLTVENADQAERAGSILRDLATVRKQAEATRKALGEPYREKVSAINDQFREPASMLDSADKVIREKLLAYRREQDRIRAEEQARIDAAAEAQRKADEAERDRLATEAREKQAAWEKRQRELAEQAKASGDAELAEAAAAARAAADTTAALARAREIEPLPVHAVERVTAPAKSEGIATRKTWTFEIRYPGSLPPEYLMPDTAAINSFMRAEVRAGRTPELPGVKFEQTESLAVRAK